jgi:hypothetical protein
MRSSAAAPMHISTPSVFKHEHFTKSSRTAYLGRLKNHLVGHQHHFMTKKLNFAGVTRASTY